MTPWAVALQAPLSMEFSRQEYHCGLPFPSPSRDWTWVSHIAGIFFTIWVTREAAITMKETNTHCKETLEQFLWAQPVLWQPLRWEDTMNLLCCRVGRKGKEASGVTALGTPCKWGRTLKEWQIDGKREVSEAWHLKKASRMDREEMGCQPSCWLHCLLIELYSRKELLE